MSQASAALSRQGRDGSIGFLIGVALIAASTLLALRPPRRPRAAAKLGYFFGLALNEVPLLWILLLTTSTVLAVADGLLNSTSGWVVLGAVVATTVGLVRLGHRALGTAAAVAGALRDVGLGSDSVGRRPVWRTLLTPLPVRPRSVERIANLSYGEGRRRRLDLYRPRLRTTSAPVLVYFHGGGYFSGGKHREARLLLHRLAERGWVCVSAGYRLRPAATFPEHLVDAKAAIAWVRDHAADYGADPSTLVLAGSSAGAHLASLAALTPNEPVFQPGFEDRDTTVSAVIGFFGYYRRYYGRDSDETPASTPLAYDATNAPPFLLVHGSLDSMVAAEGSRALAGHLRHASSNPVVHVELGGAQHGFDTFRSVRFDAVVDGVEAFLDGSGLGRTRASGDTHAGHLRVPISSSDCPGEPELPVGRDARRAALAVR